VDAFDTDVLIYAASPGHQLGRRVLDLFDAIGTGQPVGIGSMMLLPEGLSKPLRDGDEAEIKAVAHLIGRLELKPLDEPTARLAASLAASHGLRGADAVHLATAVHGGADRFITNNQKDFPKSIAEIDITYPEDLPEPEG
jgi:predicted nucleic acid-binding protein